MRTHLETNTAVYDNTGTPNQATRSECGNVRCACGTYEDGKDPFVEGRSLEGEECHDLPDGELTRMVVIDAGKDIVELADLLSSHAHCIKCWLPD